MCDERSNNALDAELRDVAVPADLSARLRDVACISDDEIDAALLTLQLPDDFAGRIKDVVADEVLDNLLSDVSVHPAMLARLRITTTARPDDTLRRFVLAASLLFVMLGSFFGAIGGLLGSMQPTSAIATSLRIIDLGPTQLTAVPSPAMNISTEQKADLFDTPTVPVVWKGGPLDVDLVRLDETHSTGPAGELIRQVEGGLELNRDVLLMRWDAYGAPQHTTISLPVLDQVSQRADVGVDLPLCDGYDRAFLMRSSTHPPVFVGVDKQLQSIRVPLSTSTASVARTAKLVSEGRRPEPQEVHIEDFLAAVKYDLPPPTNDELSMSLSAGPAIFATQEHSLVQIGIQAATRLGNRKTHMSIVVDVSQSMKRDQRLARLRNALRQLFEHLSLDDSLSLVAVNHEVTQQIDFATSSDRAELELWVQSLQAGGGDRLSRGMHEAVTLALEAPCGSDALRQLVILTDAGGETSINSAEANTELKQIADEAGLATSVIQVAEFDASSQRQDEATWQLVELATGVTSAVAVEAAMEVTFNPKAVRAYRLVGHGPSATTGLGSDSSGQMLRSGQQATLLFELWLHDNFEDDVAHVTLRWDSAETANSHETARVLLGRYDLATTAEAMAPSLRAAAIAAEIGTRLRRDKGFELRNAQRFRQPRKPADWQDVLDKSEKLVESAESYSGLLPLLDIVRRIQ